MTSNVAATPHGSGRIPAGRIWTTGLLAIVISVLVNLLLLWLLGLIRPIPADFLPLQVGPIGFFTFIGVGLGVLVFALLARITRQPGRAFLIIAVIAFVVSILPNIGLALNPAAAPFPGATASGFITLILFHVPPALISIWMLLNLAQRRA